ncbi:MAG: T9SS type A sorting domain-containing protein [Chitinophagales bacterium]|nr:T9SS type A sorting domain-containing protein [Chitinophagales bacterium]
MKTILFLLFLCAIHYCYAQNPEAKRAWHWYFGNVAGIDFSSGTAVNSCLVTINTSAIPRGIYFLRAIADAKIISQKVMLQ